MQYQAAMVLLHSTSVVPGSTKWLQYDDAWNHSNRCIACEAHPVEQLKHAQRQELQTDICTNHHILDMGKDSLYILVQVSYNENC